MGSSKETYCRFGLRNRKANNSFPANGLRDHGVSLEFIRENAKGNSVQEVIRMRDTGAKKREMM
jgi:hypothetical protein